MLILSPGKKPNQLVLEFPDYWVGPNRNLTMDPRHIARVNTSNMKLASRESALAWLDYAAITDLCYYLQHEHFDAIAWLRENKCLKVTPSFLPRKRDKHGLPIPEAHKVVIKFRTRGQATMWATMFKGIKGSKER